jgi:hypothetical protein
VATSSSPRLIHEPLSENILTKCKTLFIKEFSEVLTSNGHQSQDSEASYTLEERIASVPGLMIALFSHIKEAKGSKKKQQNKVRFSFVEEITINMD